jgi:hypothetical protein
MKKLFFLLMCIILFAGCSKVEETVVSFKTGIVGNVKSGAGDCMPMVNPVARTYTNYNGELYFIVKSQIDHLGSGDFEALRHKSFHTTVKNGLLATELPLDSFLVMPEDVYVYAAENLVVVKKDSIIKRDFSFWRCTSY